MPKGLTLGAFLRTSLLGLVGAGLVTSLAHRQIFAYKRHGPTTCRFDGATWRAKRDARAGMAGDLLSQHDLRGADQATVLANLGPPDDLRPSGWVYWLRGDSIQMTIWFDLWHRVRGAEVVNVDYVVPRTAEILGIPIVIATPRTKQMQRAMPEQATEPRR